MENLVGAFIIPRYKFSFGWKAGDRVTGLRSPVISSEEGSSTTSDKSVSDVQKMIADFTEFACLEMGEREKFAQRLRPNFF